MTHVLTAPAPAPPQTEPDTEVLEVVVTLEDIREGDAGNATSCAVARAARRGTGARDIYFWSNGGLYLDGTRWCNVDAGRWAARFDVDKTGVAPERWIFRREPAR
jgi:hypothetical protein